MQIAVQNGALEGNTLAFAVFVISFAIFPYYARYATPPCKDLYHFTRIHKN
jgi:hypothetical protein